MAIKGSKISDIKRIHSHEQGIAQCRNKIIRVKKTNGYRSRYSWFSKNGFRTE